MPRSSGRQALPEHQPTRPEIFGIGDLDGEHHRIVFGGNGQRLDLGDRRLLGKCRRRIHQRQQPDEDERKGLTDHDHISIRLKSYGMMAY
jgi:hypothetical protein